MTAPTASTREVLRRSVVIPGDLFLALERLAQRDGFASVQAWLVCRMQEYADGRAADLPEYMRSRYG